MSNFEKIEAYTEGWMTDTEREAFENELHTNAAIRQDYEDWLDAEAILKNNLVARDNSAIREILTPLTQQYFREEKKQPAKVVPFKKYLLAAVAAVLIIYLAVPAGIDSYDVPEMPQAVVRGAEELSNKGALLFNQGKYQESLPLLKEQAAARPGDATAHFFYAVSLVKTKQYAAALPVLENLAVGQSAYKDDAAFFAALAAYKLDKKDAATKYAQLVPATSAYYKKAQQVLKKVE